jgi:hypothetical protein
MTTRRVLAVLAATLVTVAVGAGCSRGTVPAAGETSEGSPQAAATATRTTVPALSDEDQVREAVLAFQDAYNTQNWDAYLELMCPSWAAQFTGPVMDTLKKGRSDSGMTSADVKSVRIVGDEATATIDSLNEMMGRKTVDLQLVREDGWRVCMPNEVR